MATDIENVDSNISMAVDNEARIEQLLSEKLMEGFVLLEKSCPVCATPLVKNQALDEEEEPVENEVDPVLIPKGSFIEPFKPVDGVPFCVGCSSHVVTQECEISILEKCDSLKIKGGIYVAMSGDESNTKPSSKVDVTSEDSVHEIIDVTKIEESESVFADEKKEEEPEQYDTYLVDYSVRREIATKVLGAKMLQGYSLMEKQCEKCAMPTMEYQGKVECVVCPALAKKARKMMKAQKKVEKETIRLESKISMVKATMQAKAIEEAALEEQIRQEEELQLEKERMELEERERRIQWLREQEAEEIRRLEIIEKERQAVAALEAESARLVEEAKAKAALEESNRLAEEAKAKAALEESNRLLEEEAKAKAALEESNRLVEEAKAKAALEASNRLVEEAKAKAALEPSNRLVEEAKAKATLEASNRLVEEAASEASNDFFETMLTTTEINVDDFTLEEMRRAKARSIEEEHAAATKKRKEMEIKLAEDIKRLEELETRRKMGIASALESMNRDVLVSEHRRRLEKTAMLDQQISRLEQDIKNEEIETKTESNEKRLEVEERMIAVLEEEAAAKAKAAEEAIRKAKAALEHVNSARREVIAHTIALAEQEAVAEAENLIKKEREDYIAPVILPSASDIKRENWETLRTEGRSIMTRRVMAGWVLLSEFCKGVECHSTPLITKDGRKECVVCGGCGDGKDGAYIEVEDYDVVPTNDELRVMRENGIIPDDEEGDGYEITPIAPRPISPTADRTFQEIQQDFETKRNMVSKEIGRRMIEGWTLLDASCPNCVMPLMMDTMGNTDICVLCGLVNNIQKTDGSTITTREIPTKVVDMSSEETFFDEVQTQTVQTLPSMQVLPSIQSIPSLQTAHSKEETKSYNEDAETMYTTLPTMTMMESVGSVAVPEKTTKPAFDLASSPIDTAIRTQPPRTIENKESRLDDLTESIRQNSKRQQPASLTPRSDPPASSKPVTRSKRAVDPAPLLTSCLSSKSSSDVVEQIDDGDVQQKPDKESGGHISENGEEIQKIEGKESGVDASAVIEENFQGQNEVVLPDSITSQEIKDIFDCYTVTSCDVGTQSEDMKDDVSRDVATQSEEMKDDMYREVTRCMDVITPSSPADAVIHLEDMPSPQNFKFDMVSEDHSKGRGKKQRPTPESLCRPRAKTGIPPRPDSTTSRSPRRPPRPSTPRSPRSPHHGTYVLTSGSSDVTSLGDVSRAETVASDALDSILDRIDAAKSILLRDDVSIQEQLAAANLIEKLAQAAVAVKKLEKLDRY